MSTAPAIVTDPHDARRARSAPGLLRAFNDAGVLAAADVHVAVRLAALCGEEDEQVALAVALAVRGPRLGHVCVDLATIRRTATVDAEESVDLAALPWPDPEPWLARLAASALVTVDAAGAPASPPRPLRLEGATLYLDRYWREERAVADDLRTLGGTPAEGIDADLLRSGLQRIFAGETGTRQALAAAAAVLSRLAVVAGGPGTGKTTTVARIVALLLEQAGEDDLRIALAAPTGKAAARLTEAVHISAHELDVAPAVRDRLLALEARTLHKTLGLRPGSMRRRARESRLPYDVVVVDETSMVSLSMMATLVRAVGPRARLVLVGDPGQLTSIEAGAVLADIVGPTRDGLVLSEHGRAALAAATGEDVLPAAPAPSRRGLGDGVVVLDAVHRHGQEIGDVAEAIRRGDGDATIAALRGAPDRVTWIDADAADPDAATRLAAVRDGVVQTARTVTGAARTGDAATALEALGAFRLLCAHRRGPYGVATWTLRIEAWLAEAIDGFGREGAWYAGRPLLVTENDHALRLNNGDTGVVVRAAADRVVAAFERGGRPLEVRPSRLGAVDTVYAMTVHKSQGSQFETAAVLLPDPASPILTRELLYTAVTRARKHLVLAGTEDAIRAAVARPVARASGLRARLWDV